MIGRTLEKAQVTRWQMVSYGTNFISGGSKMGFPSITHFYSLMLARLE